jgi:hypothetical protein
MNKEYGKFDGCILECLEMMGKSRMIGPLSIVYVYIYMVIDVRLIDDYIWIV